MATPIRVMRTLTDRLRRRLVHKLWLEWKKRRHDRPDSGLSPVLISHCENTIDYLKRLRFVENRQGLSQKHLARVRLDTVARLNYLSTFFLENAKIPEKKPHKFFFEVADLKHLEEEYPGFEVDWERSEISIVTKPITLTSEDGDDISLGQFKISYRWTVRGEMSQRFRAKALQPNPAGRNSSVTHPHVSGGAICLGEAKVPIKIALRSMCLVEVFDLVTAVLMNYNPDSPHVHLAEWHHGSDDDDRYASCSDCDRRYDADDSGTSCDRCGDNLCDSCSRVCCVCSDGVLCGACITPCYVCHEGVCNSSRCSCSAILVGETVSHHYCTGCVQPCLDCEVVTLVDSLEDGCCLTCCPETPTPSQEETHEPRPAIVAGVELDPAPQYVLELSDDVDSAADADDSDELFRHIFGNHAADLLRPRLDGATASDLSSSLVGDGVLSRPVVLNGVLDEIFGAPSLFGAPSRGDPEDEAPGVGGWLEEAVPVPAPGG